MHSSAWHNFMACVRLSGLEAWEQVYRKDNEVRTGTSFQNEKARGQFQHDPISTSGRIALPFSPTSSGRHYAGFPVVIKTPGICVNSALVNEIMLFGIISELISGPFLLFIRCILGKVTASFMLNSRKETQSLASAGSKILRLSIL